LSGVFLNYRQYFNNMETWDNKTFALDTQQRAAAQEFLEAAKQYKATFAKYSGRFDDLDIGGTGRVITVSKSGGNTSFQVPPSGENGAIVKTSNVQPWYFMNDQMHRNLAMTPTWRVLSSTLCVLIFVVLLCGFLILPWKRLEFILLLAGIALLLIGMVISQIPHGGAASEGAAITIPCCPTLGLYS
jgi:uncharacterized iron-regulated membrane protein